MNFSDKATKENTGFPRLTCLTICACAGANFRAAIA